jgi:hypothetical protein
MFSSLSMSESLRLHGPHGPLQRGATLVVLNGDGIVLAETVIWGDLFCYCW